MQNFNLSERVKELRNRKGLSQELLAENSGLSLRTIQRIENNESVPRGDTLRRLAIALGTTPDEIIDWKVEEDKTYLIIMNLTALSFLFFPILGIVVPLVMWMIKKDKIKGVNRLGKAILNFEIIWSILLFSYYIMLITGLYGKIASPILGPGHVFIYMLLPVVILYAVNIILIIINTFRVSRNKKAVYLPFIRILR